MALEELGLNSAGSLIDKVSEKGLDIYGNHLENQDNIKKTKVEGEINKELKKIDNEKDIKMEELGIKKMIEKGKNELETGKIDLEKMKITNERLKDEQNYNKEMKVIANNFKNDMHKLAKDHEINIMKQKDEIKKVDEEIERNLIDIQERNKREIIKLERDLENRMALLKADIEKRMERLKLGNKKEDQNMKKK